MSDDTSVQYKADTDYRVTAMNPFYSEVLGGCQFDNGVYEGELPESVFNYLVNVGYKVELLSAVKKQQRADDKDAAKAQAAIDAEVNTRVEAELDDRATQAVLSALTELGVDTTDPKVTAKLAGIGIDIPAADASSSDGGTDDKNGATQ